MLRGSPNGLLCLPFTVGLLGGERMGGIHIPVILRQREISKGSQGISRKVKAVQGKIRVDTFQLAFGGEEEYWETRD